MAYRARFDGKRAFGIELEGFGLSRLEVVETLAEHKISAYVGDRFDKKIPKWVVTQDGTINQTYPLEIISPLLYGKHGLNQIEGVCDALSKTEIKVNESCGLHVHWSAADYTGRNMINLLRLYGKYEKILDFIFHPSRRHSEFAHSLLREGSMTWLYRLQGAFYTHAYQIAQEFEATQKTNNKTSYPTARHHKVNICAYNKHRTVEFRQHEGTLDYTKIKNWIIFSQQLVTRAKDSMVTEGVATWDSLMKTLALTEPQLRESTESPDKPYLREARDFYKKIYRENREKQEKENAADMGS